MLAEIRLRSRPVACVILPAVASSLLKPAICMCSCLTKWCSRYRYVCAHSQWQRTPTNSTSASNSTRKTSRQSENPSGSCSMQEWLLVPTSKLVSSGYSNAASGIQATIFSAFDGGPPTIARKFALLLSCLVYQKVCIHHAARVVTFARGAKHCPRIKYNSKTLPKLYTCTYVPAICISYHECRLIARTAMLLTL
jgi:hypothetical protein